MTKAALDDGDLVYMPPADANGTGYASFAFKVSDGAAESASAYTMTVDVSAVNDAPTGSNKTVTTAEDTPYALKAADFGFADVDTDDALASVKITALPGTGKGTLTLDGRAVTANGSVTKAQLDAGNLVYTPPANANGTGYASFAFKVSDGAAESASAYTMTVDVTAANDAPTGASKTVTLAEDGSYTFKAADFGFTDSDTGDALASVKITALPGAGKGTLKLDTTAVTANGSVTKAALDAGDLVYMPPADANGDDYASFAFKVSDGTAESAASYTMTLDVTAVNDPATGLPTISGTARVGQTLTAGVSAIADDADGLPEVSTFTWQWLRASGGIDTAISGATSQTYTVAAADAGKKFKVTVSFTDLDGHPEALTSVAYPASAQVAENAAPTFGSASVTRSVEETMGDSTVRGRASQSRSASSGSRRGSPGPCPRTDRRERPPKGTRSTACSRRSARLWRMARRCGSRASGPSPPGPGRLVPAATPGTARHLDIGVEVTVVQGGEGTQGCGERRPKVVTVG